MVPHRRVCPYALTLQYSSYNDTGERPLGKQGWVQSARRTTPAWRRPRHRSTARKDGSSAQKNDPASEDGAIPDRSVIVVGIGASAGGLEAMGAFLTHMPVDSGMVFVLVQHLDPSHTSLMTELLARKTKMPVQTAEDGMRVAPNRLYVMPPNVTLTIQGGVLKTSTPVEHATVRTHIDLFLDSLAEDQAEQAVGVILSGAGRDGTLGLKSIKEHGGVTFAQFPASAKYDSMPLSAIATGLVDFTLPVEEIPAKLVEHAKYMESLRRTKPREALHREAGDHLPRICQILHHATGHDFGGYKPGTMVRRIERRMQVQHLDSVAVYEAKLEQDPQEANELLKDLLIGVTQFFRDPEAFKLLASQAIPQFLGNKARDARVRVWVPGCASGEEAYSIAMLLGEGIAKLNVAPRCRFSRPTSMIKLSRRPGRAAIPQAASSSSHRNGGNAFSSGRAMFTR